MSVNKEIDTPQYRQTLESVFPTQFEVGSLADRLLIQGREEGRQEGHQEGHQEGRQEGLRHGLLVGRIQALQEMLGDEVTEPTELFALEPQELEGKLAQLQQRVRK